jgi:gamma-glutamyltranspeptidase/glutathione hydrolase
MNGIGGDAFAMVWDGDGLCGLNASGRSPAAWDYSHFSNHSEIPRLGWDAVTVPGAVSAWVEMSDRFGDLPFEQLFEPAIGYARNGFPVSPITATIWAMAPERYGGMEGFHHFERTFLPDGRAPLPGEMFSNVGQAKTLEKIAKTHGNAFYQGELADRIVAYAGETGGLMTEEDLASHRADWVETISLDYHGLTLHEIPPNGQGIAALMMLGILENADIDIRDYPVDSADSLHLQIEAMKLAFADAHRYVSDPAFTDMTPDSLLSASYLSKRATLIDMEQAGDASYGKPGEGDTVYLTTADERGMMVSFIQSNYTGFGSGIVIPGTGIAMQNRGLGFTLEKGHPNQVDGGKRPFHTIIPAFVTREGEPVMSFGVMGGPMQPQGHAQMMVRMFDYGQNPQAAVDAPRWQVFSGKEVGLETGFEQGVLKDMAGRGHDLNLNKEFWWYGGAQMIYRYDHGGYCAASDPRKDGQAVGF